MRKLPAFSGVFYLVHWKTKKIKSFFNLFELYQQQQVIIPPRYKWEKANRTWHFFIPVKHSAQKERASIQSSSISHPFEWQNFECPVKDKKGQSPQRNCGLPEVTDQVRSRSEMSSLLLTLHKLTHHAPFVASPFQDLPVDFPLHKWKDQKKKKKESAVRNRWRHFCDHQPSTWSLVYTVTFHSSIKEIKQAFVSLEIPIHFLGHVLHSTGTEKCFWS